ncbi:serine/threonine-protein kinase [Nocardia sp. GCM10030253]|uniref:serine/threonine-protein kinase n=1 Tax=Nocardia sp. GCM10030253 TaxID=3273404 RepID=UPI003627CEE0
MSQETSSDRLVAGRYRLTGVLGRGGMGVVWAATDEVIGRQVAVKEIRAPADEFGDEERDVFMARALAEARNVGRISHPGVVALYDVIPAGPDDDAVYLIMELVAAPTLERLIRVYGKMPSREVAEIGLQILDALEAAHALDVVHRDVKPGNVLVLPNGQVKLLDFGIARAATDPRLTQWGALGTVSYMAPERFASGPITPAVDYWALGATLYRAATGSSPFERESTAQTLQAIIYQDPPTPDCDEPLSTVITALLARDPGDRPTIDRARAMLRAAATDQPPPQIDDHGRPESVDTAATLPAPQLADGHSTPDPPQEISTERAPISHIETARPDTPAAHRRAIKPLGAAALWLVAGLLFLVPGVTVIAIAANTMLTDSSAVSGAARFVGPTIGALVGLAMLALAVFPISISLRELKDWRDQQASSIELPKNR